MSAIKALIEAAERLDFPAGDAGALDDLHERAALARLELVARDRVAREQEPPFDNGNTEMAPEYEAHLRQTARTSRQGPTVTFPSGMERCPRDAMGRLLPISAIERFREKCQFQPETGCVLWIGGKTQGRGNSAVYGSFWFEGRRWFAHRWAGVFIHGLDLDGLQAGHNCPHTPDGHPNTLCVQHITGQTQLDNLAEQHARLAKIRADQSNDVRQHWLLVHRGYEEPEPTHDPATIAGTVPYFVPPAWLVGEVLPPIDDCPF